MSLKILKAGMLDSIQDMGRFGYQQVGINPTGAIDKYAAAIANILVERAMHFLSCQSLIIGPQILFDSSHRCHLSDDLAKQAADTSKKGVVGSNGKNTPITPRPKNMKPIDL